MSEQYDKAVADSIWWLVNRVHTEPAKVEPEQPVCKLNDYNEWETYQMMQQAESEDRL